MTSETMHSLGIGRALHVTLQFLDLRSPDHLVEQATRHSELESMPDLAATVAAMVHSALASEAGALAAKTPHHRELYVAAPVGDWSSRATSTC